MSLGKSQSKNIYANSNSNTPAFCLYVLNYSVVLLNNYKIYMN